MPDYAHALSDDYLKAIGRITVGFTHLENALKLSIMYLSGFEDDSVFIVMNPLSFRNLVTVFANLAEKKYADNPSKLTQLRELASSLGSAADERDVVVHSGWIGLESGKVLRFKMPRGQKRGPLLPVQEVHDPKYLSLIDARLTSVIFEVALLVAELSEASEKQ